jgi:hypothetical protein
VDIMTELPSMPDLTAVPLERLRPEDNPALDRALKRVLNNLNNLNDPNGVISAFGSFISDK